VYGGSPCPLFEVDTKRVVNWLIERANKHHPLGAGRDRSGGKAAYLI